MNHVDPTIKFTTEHSTQEISFKDMKVHIRTDYKLSTTLHATPMSLLHFYAPTLTTHRSVKKVSFCHKPSDTTSSLQVRVYYKKNLIPLQYLSGSDNNTL